MAGSRQPFLRPLGRLGSALRGQDGPGIRSSRRERRLQSRKSSPPRPTAPDDGGTARRPGLVAEPAVLDIEEMHRSWRRNVPCIAFKHVTAPTNIRTMIAAILPCAGAGNSLPLLLGSGDMTAEGRSADRRQPERRTSRLHRAPEGSRPEPQLVRCRATARRSAGALRRSALRAENRGRDRARRRIGAHLYRARYGAVRTRHGLYGRVRRGKAALRVERKSAAWNCAPNSTRCSSVFYGITDRDDIRYIYSTFPIVERDETKAYGRYLSRDLLPRLDERAGRGPARCGGRGLTGAKTRPRGPRRGRPPASARLSRRPPARRYAARREPPETTPGPPATGSFRAPGIRTPRESGVATVALAVAARRPARLRVETAPWIRPAHTRRHGLAPRQGAMHGRRRCPVG